MTFMLWALNPNQRIDALISVLCNLTLWGWSATIPQKPGASSYPFISQHSCCQSNQEFLSGGQNLCCFAESPAWIEWCKMAIKFFLMVLRATFISLSDGFEVDRTFCVMARPWYLNLLYLFVWGDHALELAFSCENHFPQENHCALNIQNKQKAKDKWLNY